MTSDSKQSQSYWLTKDEALERSNSISSISYTLSITLNQDSFSGTCSVEFDTTSTKTWLDLNSAEIHNLQINSSDSPIVYKKSKLSLSSLIRGHNQVTISYTRPYSKDGYGLHCFKESTGETYIYSNFEPFHAHKLFPCFDQPDLKACYTLSVQSPSHWKVLSNEISNKSEQNGDWTIHYFPTSLKFSTYLFALIAGDYHEVRYSAHIPMGIYCRKSLSHELDPQRYLKWTLRGFEFYEKMFAIKYPFKKYDQIFVPEFNSGAMENIGCVTYKEDHLELNQSKVQQNVSCLTFIHEMCHMWFGNLVTMKWWDDLWLNESFATYLSYLAVDKCLEDEFSQTWILFLRRKSYAYPIDQKKTTHPISCNVENTSQTRSIFDSISYSKGASVIKQIVFKMGLEDFSKAIQHYLAKHSFANTTLADFIDSLHLQKPELDLVSWSKPWLQTSGVNFFYTTINETSVQIRQTAEGTCEAVKPHDFLYELYDSSCRLLEESHISLLSDSIEITSAEPVSCVVLNTEDHSYMKVIIDEKSLSFIQSNLHRFESALTRMLVLTQLLEMLNSMFIPVTAFLQIFYNQFIHETDEVISSYILSTSATTLVSKTGNEDVKTEYYNLFFNAILEKIDLCAEFSDGILSFAYTDEQINMTRTWLSGNSPIQLTKARRWRILKQFSRLSIEAKELVDKEVDDSFEGKLARLYCQTAYPDPEAKKNAWELFMSGCPGLSRYERKSAMLGFMRNSQMELLQEYSKLYFKEIPKIKKKFDGEYLVDFCSVLFPEFKRLDFLKTRVEKTISKIGEDHKQVVRILREKVETIERNRRIKGTLKEVKDEEVKSDEAKKEEVLKEEGKVEETKKEEIKKAEAPVG